MIGWPREARSALRWLNRQRSLRPGLRALRELLPGDSAFGDPLSTTGTSPASVLARQAWPATNGGRWSVLAEMGLALLQVADWVGDDLWPGGSDEDVAILFTDLVGFSTWALEAGDEQALRVLRSIDALVSAVVAEHDGIVVKRLGDGTMAVFEEADHALAAAERAIARVRNLDLENFRPQMRAGLHYGTPRPIGNDYIGVDVNVAARLCEAASGGEVLLSGAVCAELDTRRSRVSRRPPRSLRGVPQGLAMYGLEVDGYARDGQPR